MGVVYEPVERNYRMRRTRYGKLLDPPCWSLRLSYRMIALGLTRGEPSHATAHQARLLRHLQDPMESILKELRNDELRKVGPVSQRACLRKCETERAISELA